jgi:hypothetical protein
MSFVTLLLAALIPIAAARQQPVNSTVTVMGLVTVPSGDFRSSSADEGFAIQDQTGGIWVTVPKNPHYRLGERIRVTGTLTTSESKLQITPTAFERLAGSQLLVATGQVGPATLGYLITVEGEITQPVEKDAEYGWKVFINDGSGEAQIYLNKSTDIDAHAPYLKAGRRIRVTGFGNQYGTAYEVDPRFQRDIVPLP